MNLQQNSALRNIYSQMLNFFALALHLLWTHIVLLVISRLLKIFACPYLGASHLGCPYVFRKQFVLDTTLQLSSFPKKLSFRKNKLNNNLANKLFCNKFSKNFPRKLFFWLHSKVFSYDEFPLGRWIDVFRDRWYNLK